MTEGLVDDNRSPVNADIVGVVAGQTMELIHRGQIAAATGLDDSAAYRALADLVVAGMTIPTQS